MNRYAVVALACKNDGMGVRSVVLLQVVVAHSDAEAEGLMLQHARQKHPEHNIKTGVTCIDPDYQDGLPSDEQAAAHAATPGGGWWLLQRKGMYHAVLIDGGRAGCASAQAWLIEHEQGHNGWTCIPLVNGQPRELLPTEQGQ